MPYDTLLFDLDGTLIDPKTGIVNSICHALSKLRVPAGNPDSLTRFIGPPLHESFQKYYAMTESQAHRAVCYFREYFSLRGMYESALYPGIQPLLNHLRARENRLLLATTKPTPFAERILAHFEISGLFGRIFGSNLDGTLSSKEELLEHILTNDEMRQVPRSRTVMIGDRALDVLGARKNGLDSIAVTYGYGTEDELRDAQPTHTVRSVDELRTLLCGE
jgi:phosphoglycolate phosphatase